MEDIIINGVSLNHFEALRNSIQQGGSKMISQYVHQTQALTREIVQSQDSAEIKELVAKGLEALNCAYRVSAATGVEFSLPDYHRLLNELEVSDNQVLKDHWSEVRPLYDLIQTTLHEPWESSGWYSSNC